MCNYFQEQSKDSVRQIIFSSLFSPQGNKADDSRMALLGKLVSMAVAVCRVPVLECAATWLQVLKECGENGVPRCFFCQSLCPAVSLDFLDLALTGAVPPGGR